MRLYVKRKYVSHLFRKNMHAVYGVPLPCSVSACPENPHPAHDGGYDSHTWFRLADSPFYYKVFSLIPFESDKKALSQNSKRSY